jgi:hypothetical protein
MTPKLYDPNKHSGKIKATGMYTIFDINTGVVFSTSSYKYFIQKINRINFEYRQEGVTR